VDYLIKMCYVKLVLLVSSSLERYFFFLCLFYFSFFFLHYFPPFILVFACLVGVGYISVMKSHTKL
jgi:hypothetical protein